MEESVKNDTENSSLSVIRPAKIQSPIAASEQISIANCMVPDVSSRTNEDDSANKTENSSFDEMR